MKLSIIIPFYNEEASIAALFKALFETLETLKPDVTPEIICVDDASTDQTHALLVKEKQTRIGLQIIRLSRNFGKEAALTAGLDHAKGDAVLFMDADLQHPPGIIPELLAGLSGEVDVVYGVRDSRITDGRVRAGFSRMFYSLFSRLSRVKIPPNAGDFRILSRRAADALRALPERRRFMKGLYAWIGFKQVALPYTIEPRFAGTSKWSFSSLFGYAFGGLVSFSNVPLRIVTVSGGCIALLSALYAIYIMIDTLVTGRETPGFATLAIAIFFFSGVQLLSLGVVGEYVGRIFDETKGRPTYIIESLDD